MLLVNKKDRDARLCVNYQRLNKRTVKDSDPLPCIDDLMDRLAGGKVFISLDFKSGYYQIPLSEDSKKYTAFVTPWGQFEWNKMPFGLTNAPRVFQRYMNRILKKIRKFAAVYLDDILIHAATVAEALEKLRKVLEIFRENGLTLNPKKCKFLQRVVTFLGFVVENGTVKQGEEKT